MQSKQSYIWGLIIGSVFLCAACGAEALAVVESRTRSNSGRSSSVNTSENDRAALQTFTQIEALKQEVSELRGQIEVQEHELKQLRKSQQDLYLDLEKRLGQLQQGNKNASNASTALKAQSVKEKSSKALLVVEPKSGSSVSVVKPPMVVTASVPVASANTPPSLNAEKHAEAPKKASSSEKEAYETAYGYVRSKRYAEAVSAFQAYLVRFPQGEQAANAHYWLGEVYSVQWQTDKANMGLLDKASQSFLAVREHFPNHPKATDALLKLGLVETDKGNAETARHYLTEVKNRYPGTSAARIAETRLQQLK